MRPLFGADLTTQQHNGTVSPATLMSCKMAGRAVTKVVHRCNDAKFTSSLDLSDCQLMQVPDAIYHLMRNLRLIQVNLARNVITKLPPKFPLKFSLITKLDMSHNKMRTLPDEFSECSELTTLDVSHNCFTYLPACVFKLPSLRRIKANGNHIAEIDVDRLYRKPLLVEVDLRDNPITPDCRRHLESASAPCNRSRLEVHLSPPPPEYEDIDALLLGIEDDQVVPATASEHQHGNSSERLTAGGNPAVTRAAEGHTSIPPPPPLPPMPLAAMNAPSACLHLNKAQEQASHPHDESGEE